MSSEFLRISEVAERAAVSVDTVRYYERRGLLHGLAFADHGQRRFPPETIGRIRVIRHAAAVGFTLDELIAIFRRRAAGTPPCAHALDVAQGKLAQIDARIAELQTLRRTLAGVIAAWERRMERTAPDGLAHLLESLALTQEGEEST